MKKLAALFLVFALMLSLAACGTDTTEKTTNSSEISTNSSQNDFAESTPDNKDDDKDDSKDNKDDGKDDSKDDNDDSKDDNDDSKDDDEISFTELVAVDNDECKIKITDIDPDNLWGYTLNVQLENKSAEKSYSYSVESASINGVRCDPFFSTEVAAGKKANKEISFSGSDLEDNDIGAYTDIELTFRVHDSDDWLADAVAEETVHVYPYGEDKATVFVREAQASDNVIVDNDHVTVIVTGYEADDIWGYTAKLFLINKTDKDVMFSVDEASVNGYMADPFFSTEVTAGKCAFSSMSWSDSTLEDNNITSVEEIEFKLRAYDSDDWFGDDLVSETIILKP